MAAALWGCRAGASAGLGQGAGGASDSQALRRFDFERELLGVRGRVLIWSADGAGAFIAADAAFDRAVRLEGLASVWEPDSDLARLNGALGEAGEHRLSGELAEVLSTARELSRQTEGAFDPTVGSVLAAQGYYSETGEAAAPGESDLQRLRGLVGLEAWSLEVGGDASGGRPTNAVLSTWQPGVRFDLGGLLKGLAADAMADELTDRGFERALIDLGGSMVLALDPPPDTDGWPYLIELRGNDVEWTLRHEAVAISEQLSQPVFLDGRLVSHLIDPRTLGPVEHTTLMAAVRNPSGAVADALSTATLVLGVHGAATCFTRAGNGPPLGSIWVERLGGSAPDGRIAQTLEDYLEYF